MDAQLRDQDAVAQRLRERRHAQGALEFETIQPRAVFEGERVVDIRQQAHNRARQLIEELMIATNGCIARFLAATGGASLRRVVRSPERWSRIVEVARRHGDSLPEEADSRALEAFLARRRVADPLRFPDLSLVIVKLMGSGEYVVERGGSEPVGHFGLAVRDYAHSTAPNRRFPDLITLRLVKAALTASPQPYDDKELVDLASHCTQQEDAARLDAVVPCRQRMAIFVQRHAHKQQQEGEHAGEEGAADGREGHEAHALFAEALAEDAVDEGPQRGQREDYREEREARRGELRSERFHSCLPCQFRRRSTSSERTVFRVR